MITLTGFTAVGFFLFIHWIADFVLQSDEMAMKKSTESRWLLLHCVVYGVFMCAAANFNWQFGLFMFLTHALIDGVSSQVNKYLWEKKEVHYFFVSIGFDQWLHMMCIFVGLKYLT